MSRQPPRWIAILFPLLLLGLLIGVNLAGLWANHQLREAFVAEREHRYKAETQIIALRLQFLIQKYGPSAITPASLVELLHRQHLTALLVISQPSGIVAQANTTPPTTSPTAPPSSANASQVLRYPLVDTEGRIWGQAEFTIAPDRMNVAQLASRAIFEIPLWLVSSLLVFWIAKQALSFLRQPSELEDPSLLTDTSEVRFVMEGYQQMIDRLQVKGKELERQREAERVRAESSERFSDRLVVSIPDALIVVSIDGLVSITNLEARRLFVKVDGGLPLPEPKPTSVPFQDFFAGAPAIATLVAEGLRTGETQRSTEVSAELGGKRHYLEASVSPIPGRAGTWQGVLCLVSDKTEIVELRHGLQLKETLASLGEMAAGIAHEFKNSLATISGFAQMIETDTDAGLARPARALRTEVTHLTQVVTDFLSFARPQDTQFHPVDLQELLDACCDRLRPEAEKRQVQIVLTGKFPTVAGDATLLGRAFLNLIQNGIEAIPDEAVFREVRITSDPIDPGDEAVQFCRITITDTGSGIPASDLASVFIPFFTTKSRGYGIGLAIVQKVFVGHNGRVEVASQPGHSTTFTCYLPCNRNLSSQ
ncbi:MAG: PAS domain-containing protein [Acidobacteria bacterium]|nr:PAS domain-containing protein [Acidobacteriota bacterium]